MKFEAKDAVEPLEYDLKPYSDEKGTVPEPTSDMVADFYAELSKQFEIGLGAERLEGFDLSDPADVSRLFLSLDGEDNRKLYDSLLDLHVRVCAGQPSRDALEALPFRLRRTWYGMVQGWLRPEA